MVHTGKPLALRLKVTLTCDDGVWLVLTSVRLDNVLSNKKISSLFNYWPTCTSCTVKQNFHVWFETDQSQQTSTTDQVIVMHEVLSLKCTCVGKNVNTANAHAYWARAILSAIPGGSVRLKLCIHFDRH